LTSALDEDEWSASRSGSFNPIERVPGTKFIGGWVGSTAGVDTVVMRSYLMVIISPLKYFCSLHKTGCVDQTINNSFYMLRVVGFET
jgi:hypothetical protein